ncbi:biotin--[acetyl-CoA-carboxylase] ligase [Tundrisphaera sp. TA3]|uniref:biotin--[acetyl-CoA-carboxylase] ligase n=1 Tax=Tundrisphaera sp. TA3 TaxID=3435775 RepID=UPI003EC01182
MNPARPAPPWPFVRSAAWLADVDSTSDEARRLVARAGADLPLLVGADRQTKGRGRGSHRWWSDEGSLTVTVALDPAAHGLTPLHEPRLALATAVAIVDAIETLYPTCRPGIRWPNDIEVGGRKLGGLLPERVETDAGPRILVGIGLNVRTRLDDAPAEVARMAASLVEWEADPTPDDPKPAVLRTILDRFAVALRRLADDDPELAGRWASLDTLFGAPVRIDLGTSILEGAGCGIDEAGALRVLSGSSIVPVVGGQVLR